MIFREELIQFIWSQQLFKHQELTTTSGEVVKVLFPGVWNKQGSGPDFNQASLYIGNTLFAGAVEIHIKDRDWYLHEHEKDPSYNRVVLHVVMYGGESVRREDGTTIPTLILEPLVSDRLLLKYHTLLNNQNRIPCQSMIHRIPEMILNNQLDRMSIERLQSQTVRWKNELESSKGDWHEILLGSIIRSFGLPDNAIPFKEIADHLNSEMLFRLCKEPIKLEALLFGCAGLLKLKPKDDHSNTLFKEYNFLKAKYSITEIKSQFKTGSMRPMALPSVRLAQLSALLSKGSGLISALLDFPDIEQLKNILKVSPGPYWNTHYVLGKESRPRTKALSTIHLEVIIINAIVPVLFLYARERLLRDEEEKVLSYLEHCSVEQNKIIKQWTEIGIHPINARDSQGLLHLYKTYCTFRRCLECPTGRALLSRP